MNIIIAGCGKVGTTLGEQLVRERHEVTFIDTAPELLKKVMGSNSSSLKEPKFVKEFTTENKNSYDFLYKVLSKKDKPTAIVCYNDEITINTIKICKELNITPVKDLSIVSFDNSEILSSLDYTITNIPHPKAELGKKAAQFIIEMVEGKAYKPKYTFKANLIIGNSCTPPQ